LIADNVKFPTKFALTAVFAFITTLQVPVPAHAEPLQPAKEKPDVGVAVKVTVEPWVKFAEHVLPQLMPDGELLTDPPPLLVTFKDCCGGANEAVTDWFEFKVTEHAPVPVHAPLQPVNRYPEPGVAARLTAVPVA